MVSGVALTLVLFRMKISCSKYDYENWKLV